MNKKHQQSKQMQFKVKTEENNNKQETSQVNSRLCQSQRILYIYEKPTLEGRKESACRNNQVRLSSFDFLNTQSTKKCHKKAYSLVMNYFKNEKPCQINKPIQDLYGFSKISSKIR